MREREEAYVLWGRVQIAALGFREAVDAYLGGECTGSKARRGSGNKVSIVVAVSLSYKGNPTHVKILPVSGFTSSGIAAWAHIGSLLVVECSPMVWPAFAQR